MEPQSDMAQFFDFAHASLPELSESIEAYPGPDGATRPGAHSSHPVSADGGACHGLVDDTIAVASSAVEEHATAATTWQPVDWNEDFSTWIPRYHKPQHPCDYCHSRQLECFYTFEGQSTCSPCNALFRPCSFSPDMQTSRPRNAMDTLHVVNEDAAQNIGGPTGIKSLRSLGMAEDDERGSRRTGMRFPRSAIKILKEWMEQHSEHPYPTDAEKEALALKTGLKGSQISNWMANTRRRDKNRSKRAASPSLRPSTQPINIPAGQSWEDMNPLDRWKHSPPENEPAPLSAIVDAVSQFTPQESASLPGSVGRHHSSGASSDNFSVLRAPSMTSLETGFSALTSSGSNASFGSAWSYGSQNSYNSLGSFGSNASKHRRRRRKAPPRPVRPEPNNNLRIFQCTFCTDRFKSKYDWSRHEKSLHLSLEKWICAPLGEVITCSASGQKKCVYCDALDPTAEHLEAHNYNACVEKGLEARTFYRKDHLRQHLRLMHNCKMTESMETWKSESTYIKSRCGFCGAKFDKWQDRVDHLAKEFRNGAQMKNWKGCRGLDAQVAAQVTNAMPPYLIAIEAASPFPFSASNDASLAHHMHMNPVGTLEMDVSLYQNPLACLLGATGSTLKESLGLRQSPNRSTANSVQATEPINKNATCWEILTVRLGRFARVQMDQGMAVTDDMLQREARRILYDDEDGWNQTAADNPEWLELFKKAHGILEVPPDFDRLDALEDLGMDWASLNFLNSTYLKGASAQGMECDGKNNTDYLAQEGFSQAGGWDVSPSMDCPVSTGWAGGQPEMITPPQTLPW